MTHAHLNELQGKIGYSFKDSSLLTLAMSHSSYANEKHLSKPVSYTHLTLPTN